MRSLKPKQSLLDRAGTVETIERLERASRDRLREGRLLESHRSSYWSVYTLGYVVELCLKSAFFRFCGISPHQDVSPYRVIAKDWGVQLGIGGARNLHDLVFWLRLLITERVFSNRPLKFAVASEFTARVQLVAKHWRENLRYAPSVKASNEQKEVIAAVSWIVQRHELLWR